MEIISRNTHCLQLLRWEETFGVCLIQFSVTGFFSPSKHCPSLCLVSHVLLLFRLYRWYSHKWSLPCVCYLWGGGDLPVCLQERYSLLFSVIHSSKQTQNWAMTRNRMEKPPAGCYSSSLFIHTALLTPPPGHLCLHRSAKVFRAGLHWVWEHWGHRQDGEPNQVLHWILLHLSGRWDRHPPQSTQTHCWLGGCRGCNKNGSVSSFCVLSPSLPISGSQYTFKLESIVDLLHPFLPVHRVCLNDMQQKHLPPLLPSSVPVASPPYPAFFSVAHL